MKIKKGDKVIVLKGSNKGTIGDVVQVSQEKVLVTGVNIRTIHKKPTQKGEKGEIIKVEKPVALSNVAFYDESTKKGSRIGFTGTSKDKLRLIKKTGKTIPMKKKSVTKKVVAKKKAVETMAGGAEKKAAGTVVGGAEKSSEVEKTKKKV